MIGPAVLVALALACPRACLSEQERALVEAARSWEEGRAALSRGEAEQALVLFEQALAADPDSPTLLAWHARALEQAGREEEALSALDAAMLRFPEDADLRYNRAALRARAGQLDGAAADLLILSSQGQLDAREVSQDPDLVLLRERPDLAAIVAPPRIDVALQGQDGRVLLGDSYEISFLVESAEAAPVDVRDMGQPPGLLRRARVVEDRLPSRSGRSLRQVVTTWQALRPGQGRVGPWLFSSAGTSTLTESVAIEVIELGARTGALQGAPTEALILPGELLREHSPPWLGRIGEDMVLYLSALARAEVRVEGTILAPREEWELRDAAQPVARAWVFDAPASASILIHSGDGSTLDWRWPPVP